MRNVNLAIKKESHHSEVTGKKKASGNRGEKPKGKLSILVNNLQITHIKYFAADAPENQGEIHISVDNNRKNNTVIPQPSRSGPKYES